MGWIFDFKSSGARQWEENIESETWEQLSVANWIFKFNTYISLKHSQSDVSESKRNPGYSTAG